MIYFIGFLSLIAVFLFMMSLRMAGETNPIVERMDEFGTKKSSSVLLTGAWKNFLAKHSFWANIFGPSNSEDLIEKSGLHINPEIYDILRSATAGAALVVILTAIFSGKYYLCLLLVLVKFPDWYLRYLVHERNRKMKREFLVVASRLAAAMAGGLPTEKAVEWAAGGISSKKAALKEELNNILAKTRIGLPLDQVLNEVADQTDILDLRRLAMTISQAKKLGIPVAVTLENMVSDSRQRRMSEIIGQAKSAEQKMQLALFIMAAPSIILTLAPMILQLQQNGGGLLG